MNSSNVQRRRLACPTSHVVYYCVRIIFPVWFNTAHSPLPSISPSLSPILSLLSPAPFSYTISPLPLPLSFLFLSLSPLSPLLSLSPSTCLLSLLSHLITYVPSSSLAVMCNRQKRRLHNWRVSSRQRIQVISLTSPRESDQLLCPLSLSPFNP